VEVVGGSTIAHEVIEGAVKQALAGSYYKLIPYTFRLFYPATRITEQLMQIPRIEDVRTSADGQTLTVAFVEYEPYALWCKDADAMRCLFLDAAGFAFAEAPQLTGSAFVRYVQEGKEPVLKTEGFSRAYMDTTGSLANRLEDELGLYVTDVVRKDEIDTSYFLATGAEIKVSERMTADETFINLQTIFGSEEFAGLAAGDFHYIDLRFGDKVFVSKVEVVATTTSTTTGEVAE
jgi:hypothetical protein